MWARENFKKINIYQVLFIYSWPPPTPRRNMFLSENLQIFWHGPLHTKEKIHPSRNIYTNTLCLQILIVIDGLNLFLDLHMHTIPYHTCICSYSQTPFIHSHIKSNSNSGFSNSSSTVNSAVKPQFGLQHSLKFALFCNTTVL